jgi:hypothetical protein
MWPDTAGKRVGARLAFTLWEALAKAGGWVMRFRLGGSSLDKSYTILLVPDRDAKVKKIRVEHRMLVRVAIAAAVVLLGIAGMMAHYFSVVG